MIYFFGSIHEPIQCLLMKRCPVQSWNKFCIFCLHSNGMEKHIWCDVKGHSKGSCWILFRWWRLPFCRLHNISGRGSHQGGRVRLPFRGCGTKSSKTRHWPPLTPYERSSCWEKLNYHGRSRPIREHTRITPPLLRQIKHTKRFWFWQRIFLSFHPILHVCGTFPVVFKNNC